MVSSIGKIYGEGVDGGVKGAECRDGGVSLTLHDGDEASVHFSGYY